jgi:hypothetical protein
VGNGSRFSEIINIEIIILGLDSTMHRPGFNTIITADVIYLLFVASVYDERFKCTEVSVLLRELRTGRKEVGGRREGGGGYEREGEGKDGRLLSVMCN